MAYSTNVLNDKVTISNINYGTEFSNTVLWSDNIIDLKSCAFSQLTDDNFLNNVFGIYSFDSLSGGGGTVRCSPHVTLDKTYTVLAERVGGASINTTNHYVNKTYIQSNYEYKTLRPILNYNYNDYILYIECLVWDNNVTGVVNAVVKSLSECTNSDVILGVSIKVRTIDANSTKYNVAPILITETTIDGTSVNFAKELTWYGTYYTTQYQGIPSLLVTNYLYNYIQFAPNISAAGIIVDGSAGEYTVPTVATNNTYYNNIVDNKLFNHRHTGGTNQADYIKIYNIYTLNQCYNIVASFGMLFTDIPITDNITDDNIYLGYMDGNGYCDGTYVKGKLNIDLSDSAQKDITDSEYNIVKFDSKPANKDTLIDTPLTDIDIFGFQGFLHSYLMDFDDIEGFASALNTSSVLDNINNGFFGKNPIDSVVSLTLYPIIPTTSARTPIHIAGVSLEGSVSGKPLTKIQQIYSCGNIIVPKVTNDYADYEANYVLYLPYVGTINLNPSMVVGRSLGVYYIVDFINNRGKCCVYADNQLIYDNACVIGCQIPVSATNYSQMYSTMLSSLIPSSNMSPLNIVNRTLNIATASPDTSIKSACGDFTSLAMPQTPYLVIYTPQYKSADSTAIGTIDNTIDTVSSFSYVQGKLLSGINIDDNIKSMIDNAFATGVYI